MEVLIKRDQDKEYIYYHKKEEIDGLEKFQITFVDDNINQFHMKHQTWK